MAAMRYLADGHLSKSESHIQNGAIAATL